MRRVPAARKPAASKAAASSLSAAVAPAAAKRRPRAKAVVDADDEEVMSPAVVPKVSLMPWYRAHYSLLHAASVCCARHFHAAVNICDIQHMLVNPQMRSQLPGTYVFVLSTLDLSALSVLMDYAAGQGAAHEGVALQQGLWFGQAAAC